MILSCLFYLSLIVTIFLISETFIYIYHRWIVHFIEENPLRKLHVLHHKGQSSVKEFLITGIMIVLFNVVTYYLLFHRTVEKLFGNSWIILTIIMVTLVINLSLNCYFHEQYHNKDSIFNHSKWFQNLKKNHLQHHKNSGTNYGLISNFCDYYFNTFSDPIK